MEDADARLFARLDTLGIAHQTIEHDPTHTVAESRDLAARLPGGRSKSLLVTDRDALLTLVTAIGTDRVDLKAVARAIGARGRLSFATPAVLEKVLGVAPGHLTPFALINDDARCVAQIVLDRQLLKHDPVWAHPLRNTASTAVAAADLRRFAEAHAARVIVTDTAVG